MTAAHVINAGFEFSITRVFDAPVALVYKAWADDAMMGAWWGPHPL